MTSIRSSAFLLGLLGIVGCDRTAPAQVSCKPYVGSVSITETFYTKKGDIERTFTADYVCEAQTEKGTAIGYIDSSSQFMGYSHEPLPFTSGRLSHIKNLERRQINIPESGYGPCFPSPVAVGLNREDGYLVRYEFKRK